MLGGCSEASLCPWQDMSPHTLLTCSAVVCWRGRMGTSNSFIRHCGTCTHPYMP